MTSFAILWSFLKSNGKTQASFSEDLNIQPKTLRRWRDFGFSHAGMDPIFLCKAAFGDGKGAYDEKLIKSFLQYIRKYGYKANDDLVGKNKSVDINKFEIFLSGFLSGDDCADEHDALPVRQTSEYAMPPHFIERSAEVGHLIEKAYSTPDYKVHVIVGERGLGKTTLALNYANEVSKKQIFTHVITVSYAGSLKETIERLNNSMNESGGGNLFAENIMMLKRLQKSGDTLLIIDNYDNPNLNNELAADCEDYTKILNTGCKILITSNSDLSQCYCIDNHVTYLSPLSTDDLLYIFKAIKGNDNEDDKDIQALIEKYLLSNTYLVVLSAELSKQGMAAKEIINAIKEMKTDDTDIITTHKDGKRQDEKNLLDHYCCVLENNKIINPSDMEERAEVYDILSLLSLLPIGGMHRIDLEDISCNNQSSRKALKRVIARLKNHNLVFENGTEIYLQPVVKEYLVRNTLIFGKYVYTYLSNLSRKLEMHTYSDGMLYWLGIAEAAYAVIGDEYIRSDAVSRTQELSERADVDKVCEAISLSTLLCSRIISCYNAINIYQKAYEYALLALPGLKNARHSQKQTLDMATLAYCYSAVGHALILGAERDAEQVIKSAFSCLKTAEEYVQCIDDRKLLTKVHGEFAAYYLKIQDYTSALDYHTKALEERVTLANQNPENEEFLRMTAFTYRGIGTDHFYLSREGDTTDHLRRSYEYHLLSVNLFEKLYGIRRLETVTGLNRLIGTGITLIHSLPDNESIGRIFDCSLEELCESFYNYLSEIFGFYGSCAFALNFEIEDSLKKLAELTKLMIKNNIFSKANKKSNESFVCTAKELPLINSACLDLCSYITSLTD